MLLRSKIRAIWRGPLRAGGKALKQKVRAGLPVVSLAVVGVSGRVGEENSAPGRPRQAGIAQECDRFKGLQFET